MSRLKMEHADLGTALGFDNAVLWYLDILVWVSSLGASVPRSVEWLHFHPCCLIDFRQDTILQCGNWPCECGVLF